MIVAGVDGGNSKTELLAASLEGELLARVRGPGSNLHGIGAARCAELLAGLYAEAGLAAACDRAALFLCGVDLPSDAEAVRSALAGAPWLRRCEVDNDTAALLWAGTDAADAVAVVCGAGMNVAGRAAGGRSVRSASLGWETGDWGGSEQLGRELLFEAARAADGRAAPSALVETVCRQLGLPSIAAVGEEVHFGRLPVTRLGELAPAVVAAAAAGDVLGRRLVGRLADEIALLAWRTLRQLDLLERPATVVLGGGMLQDPASPLVEAAVERLAARAPLAAPLVCSDPPVLGAALAALAAAGAGDAAAARLRSAVRAGRAGAPWPGPAGGSGLPARP